MQVNFINTYQNSNYNINQLLNGYSCAKKYNQPVNFTGKATELCLKSKMSKECRELLEKSIETIKKDLKKAIESNNVDEILSYLGYIFKKNKDNNFILEKYCQPSHRFSFSDLGINEDNLFKRIFKIEGNATFENSNAKNLQICEEIGGDADFRLSEIKDLGNLKRIGKNAKFSFSAINRLKNLEEIGGNADFSNSLNIDLENLKRIGRTADFFNSDIRTLKNMVEIGVDVNFTYPSLENLGNLKFIGGNLDITSCKLTPDKFNNVKINGLIKQ